MRSFTARAALAALLPSARADDFNSLQLLTQDQFHQLAQDLGAASSYKYLAPAAPLGLAGFDIAFSSSFTSLQYRDAWRAASAGSDVPSTVPVTSLRIAKGLPLGIDIGATLGALPGTGARLAGAELRWALLGGGVLEPAVGLRLSYSQISGVDQFSVSNTGVDLAVSKGFPIVTPYAGIGAVRTSAKAKGVATLASESPTQTRLFGGGHFNFGFVDLTIEADRTGKTSTVSGRLGLRF